jgi:hypothetical protein
MLKSQDILLLLCLVDEAGARASTRQLARRLGLSKSEVTNAKARVSFSGLYDKDRGRVRTGPLLEFLEHGLKYAFAARPGEGEVLGVPTAHSAHPLRAELCGDGGAPLVWIHPEGAVRGRALAPLYHSVPDIALADDVLYRRLTLVDALRVGRARERNLAIQFLREDLCLN